MELNHTHDPAARSWLVSANEPGTDFPIQNLPFGVFRRRGADEPFRGGVAIGDQVIDLAAVSASGVLDGLAADAARAAAQPALNDLLAGQVQFMFDSGPGLRQVAAGKLRLLAVGSPERAKARPDTPTLAESGMPGFDADTVFGIYAPAKVDRDIVNRLNAEINKQLNTPKVQEALLAIGTETVPMTVGEFNNRMRRDRERLGGFIREAGVRAE